MEPRSESLSFGLKSGPPCRLEVRLDSMGELHFTLFRGLTVVDLFRPTLVLLRYMAERPNTELKTDDILNDLWPESGPNIVEKHISFLRNALEDTKAPKEPSFIKTIHGSGYAFTPEVTRVGDLGDMEAYPEWSNKRFFHLVKHVERGTKNEDEDLRIVCTALSCGVGELKLERLILNNRVRIRILMINPNNVPLIEARYLLRRDKSYERCIRELKDQVTELDELSRRYPAVDPEQSRGSLEFHLSDAMPCGCVIHTANWALLGIFLAHDTYSAGPMIEVRGDSEPWKMLYEDWKVRWTKASRKDHPRNDRRR